jgi:hypothetical protein
LFASVANALGLVALLASFLALTIEIRVRGDKVLLFFTKLPFLPDYFSLLTCLFFALVVNMNSSSLNYQKMTAISFDYLACTLAI